MFFKKKKLYTFRAVREGVNNLPIAYYVIDTNAGEHIFTINFNTTGCGAKDFRKVEKFLKDCNIKRQ